MNPFHWSGIKRCVRSDVNSLEMIVEDVGNLQSYTSLCVFLILSSSLFKTLFKLVMIFLMEVFA